jgi:hypothetical protein
VESSTLLQDHLAGEELVAAAATWTTVTLLAGTLAGGPIVASVGAQAAMLASAAGTFVRAAAAAMAVGLRGSIPR